MRADNSSRPNYPSNGGNHRQRNDDLVPTTYLPTVKITVKKILNTKNEGLDFADIRCLTMWSLANIRKWSGSGGSETFLMLGFTVLRFRDRLPPLQAHTIPIFMNEWLAVACGILLEPSSGMAGDQVQVQ